jgi:gamma-glutamyltranspeptidase
LAFLKHGRLPWNTLFHPAIGLAENGFTVPPTLGEYIANDENKIMSKEG